MSDYIAFREFTIKDFFNDTVTIPAGASLNLEKGFLVYKKKHPICLEGSAVCTDNLIYNKDNNYKERYLYENYIIFSPRKRHWYQVEDTYDEIGNRTGQKNILCSGRFTPEEENYIREHFRKYIIDGNVFRYNKQFYTGNIDDIKRIYQYLYDNALHDTLED